MAFFIHYNYTGVDFSASRLTELVFQPEDEAIPFSFEMHEDQIPEEVEYFPLFLSMNDSQQGLQLMNAVSVSMVKIQDNGLCTHLLVSQYHPTSCRC